MRHLVCPCRMEEAVDDATAYKDGDYVMIPKSLPDRPPRTDVGNAGVHVAHTAAIRRIGLSYRHHDGQRSAPIECWPATLVA